MSQSTCWRLRKRITFAWIYSTKNYWIGRFWCQAMHLNATFPKNVPSKNFWHTSIRDLKYSWNITRSGTGMCQFNNFLSSRIRQRSSIYVNSPELIDSTVSCNTNLEQNLVWSLCFLVCLLFSRFDDIAVPWSPWYSETAPSPLPENKYQFS